MLWDRVVAIDSVVLQVRVPRVVGFAAEGIPRTMMKEDVGKRRKGVGTMYMTMGRMAVAREVSYCHIEQQEVPCVAAGLPVHVALVDNSLS